MAYYLNKQNDMVCKLMKKNEVSWETREFHGNETLESRVLVSYTNVDMAV